jgi:polyisoprenoid-binding protein YceI
VRGHLTTADGWPVQGAAVTVIGSAGQQLGRATADPGGAFTVPVAGPGPVTVILAAPGVDPVARSTTVEHDRGCSLGVVVLSSARRTTLPSTGLWSIDPAHSIIRATARHIALSGVEGRFTDFTGNIRIVEPIEQSEVQVTIEAASIATGNTERDAHLRSGDFLDVERFPFLIFSSSRVTRRSEKNWRVTGLLTIRDISREIVLETTYLGSGADPWGGTRIAVVATTELARRDYELNWNMGIPGGLVVVGPTLRIHLHVQAVLQPDDATAGPDAGGSAPA